MGPVMETRNSDFHFFLSAAAQRFDCLSIFNSEFKCLHISTSQANNSVGLMQGLKFLKNFFSWDGSQVVIHNDPQLGCSQLNRIQFLFSCESFHFCTEESFSLPWEFSKKIIKIPPIPIIEGNRINTDILNSLTGQSDCPSGLREFLLGTFQKIEKFQHDFKRTIKANPLFSNKDVHKEYLTATATSTLKAIKSKTYMSSQIEYELDANAILKLKATTSELGVRIDFQGTGNQSAIQLADSVTDSVCFRFFADYFQFGDYLNEATFSNFQIVKPAPSFVNSKVFSNKLYSDLCGPDLLNQALLDCISDKQTLKPYLSLMPYYQFSNPAKNEKPIELNIPNCRPQGSLGTTYLFEPMLCSKPTPGGSRLPDFRILTEFGLEVLQGQFTFRTQKAKEINDYLVTLRLSSQADIQISVIQPVYPNRMKLSRNKMTIIKPVVLVNDVSFEKLSGTQLLKKGDTIEFKSGSIDFA